MADAFLMSRLFVCFFVVVWHATRFQILPAGPPSPVIVSHDVKHESVAGLDFAENNNNNNNNNQKNPNGMSVDRLDDTWRPITWPARLTCWSDPEVVFLSTLSGRVTSAVLSLSFLCFFFFIIIYFYFFFRSISRPRLAEIDHYRPLSRRTGPRPRSSRQAPAGCIRLGASRITEMRSSEMELNVPPGKKKQLNGKKKLALNVLRVGSFFFGPRLTAA